MKQIGFDYMIENNAKINSERAAKQTNKSKCFDFKRLERVETTEKKEISFEELMKFAADGEKFEVVGYNYIVWKEKGILTDEKGPVAAFAGLFEQKFVKAKKKEFTFLELLNYICDYKNKYSICMMQYNDTIKKGSFHSILKEIMDEYECYENDLAYLLTNARWFLE